jgi:DHA1 family multidrug resistance protein-like MFS transporter
MQNVVCFNFYMEEWKSTLGFSWIAQIFSIMGFSFALPFVPFYLQQLGVTDQTQIRIWTGAFGAVGALTMAIMTPFWGYLADRIGRKPMTLRASLGGAVVLFGMGLAQSPQMLLVFRSLQGVFTGTVTAYLTLVVSKTPKERIGFAIGLMNSAVFCGNSVAPLLGGMFADLFGYRASFFVAAGLLFVSFLTSLIFVRERFKPESKASFSFFSDTKELLVSTGVFPIVGMGFFYAVSRRLQIPMLPLLVQELVSTDAGLATRTGVVTSVAGAAAVLAGIVIGTLADRGKFLRIGVFCSLLGSLFVTSIVFVSRVWQLVLLNFLFVFFIGGLDPILKVLLARIVPTEKRGSAFGVIGSARAFGWSAGELSGGIIAATFGLRSVFAISALFFVGIAGALASLGRGKEY